MKFSCASKLIRGVLSLILSIGMSCCITFVSEIGWVVGGAAEISSRFRCLLGWPKLVCLLGVSRIPEVTCAHVA